MTSFHGRQAKRVTVTATRRRGRGARGLVAVRHALRGTLTTVLQSRYAPYVAEGITLAAVIFAALPDGGVRISKWVFFPGIAVLYFLGLSVKSLVEGTRVATYARTSSQLGKIIGSLAAHSGGGRPKILKQPEKAVELLLRRAKELTEAWLRVPAGTLVSANLLLPVADDSGKPIGLIATDSDDYQPDRRHEIIPLDAPGAAEAFLTGKAVAIPCTDEAGHPRLNDRPYKSVAAFPICVGEAAQGGVIVAVLSVDSTAEYTFDEGNVKKLEPFISPIAQLVGLALELRKQGGQ